MFREMLEARKQKGCKGSVNIDIEDKPYLLKLIVYVYFVCMPACNQHVCPQ